MRATVTSERRKRATPDDASPRPEAAGAGPVESPSVPGLLAGWQVARVSRHVEHHLGAKLPGALLASEVRLSASHFARVFRRSFGCTPHRYVTARRMQRARALLVSTSCPLSEVALHCGLSDQAHLSRLFKQDTGLTPSQWRRQHAVFEPAHTEG